MEMYVLNLVDYQVKGWMTWKRDSKWAKQIWYFRNSQLLCIVEILLCSTFVYCQDTIDKYRLSLYKYDSHDNVIKKLATVVLVVPQNIRHSQLQIVKLNQNSMMGLYDKRLNKQNIIYIHIFSVHEQMLAKQKQKQHVEQANGLQIEEEQVKLDKLTFKVEQEGIQWDICSARIIQLVQVREGVLFIKVRIQPDKDKLGAKILQEQQKLQEYQKQIVYVWHYKTKQINKLYLSPHNLMLIIDHFKQLNVCYHFCQFIGISRVLRRQAMKLPHKKDSKTSEQYAEYSKWYKLRPTTKKTQILFLNPSTYQIEHRQQRVVPITGGSTLPTWPHFAPVSYNKQFFVEFYEEKNNKVLQELPDDFFAIVAHWMQCLMTKAEVDDDLVFEVVSILGMAQHLNWEHFIKNDS